MREARPNLNVNYLCYALRALFWTLIIINWTLIISLIFILVLFDKLQFIFTTLKKCLIFLCISRATNEKNAANAPCCKIK